MSDLTGTALGDYVTELEETTRRQHEIITILRERCGSRAGDGWFYIADGKLPPAPDIMDVTIKLAGGKRRTVRGYYSLACREWVLPELAGAHYQVIAWRPLAPAAQK